ncbi:STAS/SEC14 domain-containing protein [Thalassotalea litorea]|uniref:STAS/SEC14 domain-containing protein n=1 Tax=Thalassotalea litorea TaxID=2020715 RepID=A0A5R9IMM4_9GAMM|nr:STAS/SEC14 domain-containing protein [Thalassotalea litorea]TLU65317.1 STAS/SEC14 domain-containing protein [Thalassotalea litorea]
MVEELAQSEGKYFGVKLSGTVGIGEEQKWLKELDKRVMQYDNVSLLLQLDDGAGWGLKAGWQDIKWVFHNMKHIDKVAVVSDSKVWEWLVKVDALFAKVVNIDESHFTHEELEQAWTWLKS